MAYTVLNNNTSNSIFLNTSAAPITGSTYTINTSASNGTWATAPMTVNKAGSIELRGEDADVIINGKSLCDAISSIENRLAMLSPNVKLEAEWAELKRLGDAYRELEKDINEKMKTWDILKRED